MICVYNVIHCNKLDLFISREFCEINIDPESMILCVIHMKSVGGNKN